jgi:hypothetical protein
LHVDNTWPLSCYPAFDGPTSDTVTELSIQIPDAGTAQQDWNLSSDLKLRTVYRGWFWLAQEGTAAGPATRPKVAALVNLWLKAHPDLHVKNVVVSLDWYQMRPLAGSRVRVARQKNWQFAFE